MSSLAVRRASVRTGHALFAILVAVGCQTKRPLRAPPFLEPRGATMEEAEEGARTVVPEGREAVGFTVLVDSDADPLRLSEQPVAYPAFEPPGRPRPLIDVGTPFLDHGPIEPGIETPSGQMLQPSFLVYGKLRSAVQASDDGVRTRSEWANRLDVHADLKLSGTERIVASFRPLDTDRGRYTGVNFWPSAGDEGRVDGFNSRLRALFFEGELGEIFPGLDPGDRGTLDWGFSVGRQPFLVQDGLLIDDDLDLFGVTRNSLTASGVSNLRVTGIFAWNVVHRGVNREERGGYLVGLLSSADTEESTLAFDLLYVNDEDDRTDAWYTAASSTRRFGALNSTLRVAASIPVHDDTPLTSAGLWLASELSRTLKGSDAIAYWNVFWSVARFTAAATGDDRGGPERRTGILYEPVGMGRYGAPMGGATDDTIGTALGTQLFLNGVREHVVLELAARDSTHGGDEARLGFGARYQRAVGSHYVLRLDAFAAAMDRYRPRYGLRLEWAIEF